MNSYELLWIPMNSYEFLWIPMNSYEFLGTSCCRSCCAGGCRTLGAVCGSSLGWRFSGGVATGWRQCVKHLDDYQPIHWYWHLEHQKSWLKMATKIAIKWLFARSPASATILVGFASFCYADSCRRFVKLLIFWPFHANFCIPVRGPS